MCENSTMIHIISLNAQGLRNKLKRGRLQQWLIQQKADIALIQETHFSADLSNYIKDEFKEWEIIHSYGSNTSKGCSVFISNTLLYTLIKTLSDTEGRYLLVNIELYNNIYSILNIYAPNDKKVTKCVFQQFTHNFI